MQRDPPMQIYHDIFPSILISEKFAVNLKASKNFINKFAVHLQVILNVYPTHSGILWQKNFANIDNQSK